MVVPSRSLRLPSRILAFGLTGLLACAGKTPTPTERPAAPVTAAPDADDDELATRLEHLEAALEKARVEHHVPGMAIAVVEDGEVVLARGFGHADLVARKAATEDTVFAIGSSTKAFTSTLVGMLVDDGKLKWDDPIETHVPQLKLPVDDDGKGTKPTLRDAMSHRTGFTRMSLLWVGGAVDTNELMTRASQAEPWAKYREKFLYNNVIYASAGFAAAHVAGQPWEALLDARLLKPLHMDHTTADQARAEADRARAQGYRWDDEAHTFIAMPMRPIPAAAPAGAIYSTASDMAHWLQFQLADGEVDGKRLISKASLHETRSPQMQMAPTLAYGLGWMLADREGKRLVHHGGNIDGYSAMVAMIPDEHVGYVLLTNANASKLLDMSRALVFDALLAPLDDGDDATSHEDLSPYLGKYVADFGPFDDTDFTVTAKDGKLFVDVPGQTNYELRPPGDDGRRPFALTDQIAVSFERDDAGEVVVMRMHQAGLDFEVPRRGYVPPPAIPLDELQPLLGEYAHAQIGPAQVTISNNRLAVGLPKQMKLELDPPDAAGRRAARVKSSIQFEFRPVDGPPTTLVLHEAGQEVEFRRTKATAAPLPSVDELMKRWKVAKAQRVLEREGTLTARGKVHAPQSAVDGTFEWIATPDGVYALTVDFGKFGRIQEVTLADRAWSDPSFAPRTELRGKYLDQARAASPLALLGDWRETFDEVRVTGRTERDGTPAFTVSLTRGDAPPILATVDAKTGDVLATTQTTLEPGGVSLPTQTTLSEYRRVRGLRIPHHIERRDESSGKTVIDVETVERYRPDDPSAFPPAPPAEP